LGQLQKTKLAEAIRYALSRWTGLCLFLEDRYSGLMDTDSVPDHGVVLGLALEPRSHRIGSAVLQCDRPFPDGLVIGYVPTMKDRRIDFSGSDFPTVGGFPHVTQQAVMPVVAYRAGGEEVRPLGTCFNISPHGLALTARHVIDEALNLGHWTASERFAAEPRGNRPKQDRAGAPNPFSCAGPRQQVDDQPPSGDTFARRLAPARISAAGFSCPGSGSASVRFGSWRHGF
jgi:hypothetical protein